MGGSPMDSEKDSTGGPPVPLLHHYQACRPPNCPRSQPRSCRPGTSWRARDFP